jgi:hypothetical protein
VLQRALADSEHYLGPDHPMTRTVRDNLAAAVNRGKLGPTRLSLSEIGAADA